MCSFGAIVLNANIVKTDFFLLWNSTYCQHLQQLLQAENTYFMIEQCQLPGRAWAFKYLALHPCFTSPYNGLKHHLKPSLLHFKLVPGNGVL